MPREMPSAELPEMMFRSSAVVPPIVVPSDPFCQMPLSPFASGTIPFSERPMMLPWMSTPYRPGRRTAAR